MNFSQNSWTFFRLELFEIREIYFVEIDELFSNSWFLSKFHALFSNLCLFFKTNVIFSKMWLFIYLKIDENIQIHVFFIKIDESFQICELFSNPMIFSYLWTFFKLQSFLNPANFFWAHELFEFMNLFICGLFRTVIFFELVKHFLNYWFFFKFSHWSTANEQTRPITLKKVHERTLTRASMLKTRPVPIPSCPPMLPKHHNTITPPLVEK